METIHLLLGVLLLSYLTVSEVFLDVHPNLQQIFPGSSMSLRCVSGGGRTDGWTVRSRGGHCGPVGADFGVFNGSHCVLSHVSVPDVARYWCESSSGEESHQIYVRVSAQGLILEIPALPVLTGSDVTLHCRHRNGQTVTAEFYFYDLNLRSEYKLGSGPKSEHTITNVQKSDEGDYWCRTEGSEQSHWSYLRVKDPPSSLLLAPVSAGLVFVVVSGLVLVGSRLTGVWGERSISVNSRFGVILKWGDCLCFSGLVLLTAAGVSVLLLCALAEPLPESRLFCHIVVVCPYCISTVLLLSICCSRKTGNKPLVSMEMNQNKGGQGLEKEEYDDIAADVTTEHDF
ncbi:uncharacterized protein KZ484_007499 [Pholidichthys leucotaenia]